MKYLNIMDLNGLAMVGFRNSSGWNPNEYGCLVAAIDIKSLTDLSLFKQSVTRMCTALRGMPAGDGFDDVVVPGDRGHAKKKKLLAAGQMDVDDNLIETLKAIADKS